MSEKKPLVVALYLPQFYETEYNNNGGKRGIRNGMHVSVRSLFLRDIINPVSL